MGILVVLVFGSFDCVVVWGGPFELRFESFLVVQVHGSVVGKYIVELLRLLLLSSYAFLMKVGHCRLQLGWLSVLHETQFFTCEEHWLVLW